MKNAARKVIVGIAFCGVLGAFAVGAYVVSHKESADLLRELVSSDGHVAHAYFSPQDGVKAKLIGLIDAEQKSIDFAIYTLTDKQVAQAFIRAAKRGVRVEGVVDRSYGDGWYSSVGLLANAQVPIWVYQTSSDEKQSGLMHNKFCLFGQTVGNKALIWTGSYNFTKRANEKNEENVVILDHEQVITQFQKYFKSLKGKSLQISGVTQPVRTEKEAPKHSWLTLVGAFLS